ncbi:MAG: hypothetical protein AABX52_02240 [Nanoarchaeota archaeon]
MDQIAFRFIILCSLFLSIMLGFFTLHIPPTPQGGIVAQGGNVTRLDLSQPDRHASLWKGLYGNLTETSNNASRSSIISFIMASGSPDVQLFNIPLFNCSTTNVYATTENTTIFPGEGFINSLNPASHADVDRYLLLGAGVLESAPTIFTLNKTFNVGNNVHTLISTNINAVSGNYTEGVLIRPNRNLVFAAKIINGLGWTGEPIHYEMILPQLNSSVIRWYFFTDLAPGNACPLDSSLPVSPPSQPVQEEPIFISSPQAASPTSSPAIAAAALLVSSPDSSSSSPSVSVSTPTVEIQIKKTQVAAVVTSIPITARTIEVGVVVASLVSTLAITWALLQLSSL